MPIVETVEDSEGRTRLYSWASLLEEQAHEQALRTSRLPILAGPVALMPDAHWGMGATIGSVVATDDAIVPSCVGVDIGCGMHALALNLRSGALPDNLDGFLDPLARAVPAGMGKGHALTIPAADEWMRQHPAPSELSEREADNARSQLGTLGGGNHFLEVCLDETDRVWLLLHSGSRGIGKRLADRHIAAAKGQEFPSPLEDPDLAWLTQGTPEFDAYIADMLWAQDYAMENRRIMMARTVDAFGAWLGIEPEWLTDINPTWSVNTHHNYAAEEEHDGRRMWITRKGAIRAGLDELGIIPGSMGAETYIVRGLGNPLSYCSCSHGAGRLMSRKRARTELTVASFQVAMRGKSWQDGDAEALLDEHPSAYKPMDVVMRDQTDLVEPVHKLHQIQSYKGVGDAKPWERKRQ